jgi:molybdenum cofactor guanylyltransferase
VRTKPPRRLDGGPIDAQRTQGGGDTAKRVQGLILAGGASRRYGSDKAFAIWNGKTFLANVGEALKDACDEIWVLGRPDVPLARYHKEIPEARVRVDVQVQAGPVVAIREAMRLGRSDFVVVAPCDAPALTREDVAQLVTAARQSKGPAVAVSDDDVLFDLFCIPRVVLEQRLEKAKRLEDLVDDAAQVPLGPEGLNVNEPD